MSIINQHMTNNELEPARTNPLRAPTWFRYGVMAAATLILCSCRSVGPVNSTLPDNRLAEESQRPTMLHEDSAIAQDDMVQDDIAQDDIAQDNITPAAYQSKAEQQERSPVVPAIYIQDSHAPPPGIRQAEYQNRKNTPGCPTTTGCQACGCGHAPPTPQRDEYLCDGGDDGFAAKVQQDWQINGLGQEDTVAHYDTVDGRTVVTPSNRVCVYAPRFGVVRREVNLQAYARYDMSVGFNDTMALAKIDELEKAAAAQADLEPNIHRAENPPSLLRERQQLGEFDNEQRLAEFDGSLAPYANLKVIRVGLIDNGEKALLARASLAAITWTGDQSAQISIDNQQAVATVGQRQPGVVYHQKDPTKPRLRLVKLASTGSAQPGEEIEFTLRFDNIGSQVMGNVTVVDHLTKRLEYVPDSAKSSVAADFTLQPSSSGGSAVLRWEIKEPLEAKQGGILQFKCKVL